MDISGYGSTSLNNLLLPLQSSWNINPLELLFSPTYDFLTPLVKSLRHQQVLVLEQQAPESPY